MNKRRNVLTLATAAIIVLIFVLYMITYVVREGEVAVLTTFQKVVGVVENKPGLYWKLPPPIQRVVKFDARLHTDKDRFEETKTSDGVLLVLLAYYTWRVEEPKLFYTKFYTRDRTETLKAARKALGDLVRDAKDDVFGQYAFADLMPRFRYGAETVTEVGFGESSRPREVEAAPKFREIEADILSRIKDKALSEYGVAITQVGIMRFELPQATTDFVFRRMREERERVAAGIRASGKGEADRIRIQADNEYKQTVAAANGQAQQEQALGDKEAAEYYDTFARNRALHDFLRKLQAMSRIIDDGTTLILSTDSEPFELLRGKPEDLVGSAGASGADD